MTLAEMERLKVTAKNRGRDRPQPQHSKRPKLEPKVREMTLISSRARLQMRLGFLAPSVKCDEERNPSIHLSMGMRNCQIKSHATVRDQKSHNVPVASSQTAYIEPHIFCLYKCFQSGYDDCNSN